MKDAGGKILHRQSRLTEEPSPNVFSRCAYGARTRALVERVDDIEWIVTNTEKEALILESNLVKLHKPRYNVR